MSSINSLLMDIVVIAIVIWIVGKLNLGLAVRNFVTAIFGAIAIVLINYIFDLMLVALGVSISGGLIGAVTTLIIAALVLMICGMFVPGMVVKGFSGAFMAAIAISVINFFVNWAISIIRV